MKLYAQYQGASNPLRVNGRETVTLDNEKRNGRLRVKISAPVTVAGANAGLAKNGGSLLAALQLAVTENGYDFMRMMPAWCYKQIAEYDAEQPLGFARLADNAVIGVYNLFEILDIPFARARQAIPAETSFLEANVKAPFYLSAQRNANADISIAVPGGGGTVTIGNIVVEVVQIFSDAAGHPLPLFKPGFQPMEQPVAGAIANLPMDFKISDRVSDVVIFGQSEDAAGGTILAPAGVIINALAFRGSGDGEEIIGPQQVPFDVLVNGQREYAGGDVAFQSAIYQHSFMPTGMLSDTIDPNRFQNLRLYFNAQPRGGGHVNSRLYVAVRTLERPEPKMGWPVVVPASALPSWALS